jgi:RNA polymerase sigma-70 factor (ECF subfamily)
MMSLGTVQEIVQMRPAELTSAEEVRLVADLRGGRREAFDRVVGLHYERLYRLAYSMTGVAEDARDLTQETFLAAVKSMANFRADSKLSTWLIAILRNQYTLYLRGVAAILERLRKLPEDLRTTLVLFYLDGMKYSEIAEAMGCPLGTVRSRLFEARERLKKMMEGAKA